MTINALPNDYVVLDLETTGISWMRDTIIEFGAVKVVNREPVSTFQQLVNPMRPLNPFITNLTGITPDMLDPAPMLDHVLPEFLDWCGDNALVGHNILRFDIKFIDIASQRILHRAVPNQIIDTLQMSRDLFPSERHHRLADLIQRFDIADVEEHRALSDAEQTRMCFEWMRDWQTRRIATIADSDMTTLDTNTVETTTIKTMATTSDSDDIVTAPSSSVSDTTTASLPTRFEAGAQAPNFSLPSVQPDGSESTVTLSDILAQGKRVILYFYPAAMTPGCTTEACDFRDNIARLTSLDYTVLGVSKDPLNKLHKFAERDHLTFPLLSDPDLAVHKMYGAYGEKKLYGKVHIGVIRSTFAIERDGHITLARYNVRAKGHVDSLMKRLG